MKKQTVMLMIAVTVTVVWASTVLFEVFTARAVVSPYVHGIMGMIAAYFFKENFKDLSKVGDSK